MGEGRHVVGARIAGGGGREAAVQQHADRLDTTVIDGRRDYRAAGSGIIELPATQKTGCASSPPEDCQN